MLMLHYNKKTEAVQYLKKETVLMKVKLKSYVEIKPKEWLYIAVLVVIVC